MTPTTDRDTISTLVSPRFGPLPQTAHGRTTRTTSAPSTSPERSNPDTFQVQPITVQAPLAADGQPLLYSPGQHRVSPLDLAKAADVVRERKAQWDGRDADGQPFDDVNWREYIVRDSTRKYSFMGKRLAFVSSETATKSRWTEIEIYRCQGGTFIVHRIGVSALAHHRSCPQLVVYSKRHNPGVDGVASDEFAPKDRIPCPDCRPNIDHLLANDPGSLRFERDRHQVAIAETAEGVVQALHVSRDGVKELGGFARLALQMAADRDPLIAAVFYGQPESSSPIVYRESDKLGE